MTYNWYVGNNNIDFEGVSGQYEEPEDPMFNAHDFFLALFDELDLDEVLHIQVLPS